jgi:hypothetical protein
VEYSGRLYCPVALPWGKSPVHVGYEAGRSPEQMQTVGRRDTSLAPSGNLLVVQVVNSRNLWNLEVYYAARASAQDT